MSAERSGSGRSGPGDAPGLPRQRRGTVPQGRGRYPDYDVLDQAAHWDPATRRVVLARLGEPPAPRSFDAAQTATLRAFCDTVMAQDSEPRIPVLAVIDARLADGILPGYRYADMPEDVDTWRGVARGLDAAARAQNAESYAEAPADLQEEICRRFADSDLDGGVWEEIPVARAWKVVMGYVLGAFYAHPWAWNEIGFGGPAYPRGYSRLGIGQRESHEGREEFSVDPVSDVVERGLE